MHQIVGDINTTTNPVLHETKPGRKLADVKENDETNFIHCYYFLYPEKTKSLDAIEARERLIKYTQEF